MKPRDAWKKNLAVLGLPRHASWEQIVDQFRQLVLAHHPDVTSPGQGSTESFRRIVAAYEELAARSREHHERSPAYKFQLIEDPRVIGLTVEELGERLRYSSSPKLRSTAALLLGEKGGELSRRLLLQGLQDGEAAVRQAVLRALGRVGKPGDLLPSLPRLWQSGHPRIGDFLGSSLHIWMRALRGLLPSCGR